ncbi:FliI/YscN family ATPase [Amylibacter sp. SFDW26]|uniref:FliI/YscN family ATPase n=1 Tax=Amylibacter sp. SFDW26 TaxID=2652722 RepID=UPI001261BCC9|nr:FliI/YscN family ATPase [Amylibacter sp. SFDW26]KAB7613606.1 FliI/YscN family ATPase [Amylibacter sp. SFDW26]
MDGHTIPTLKQTLLDLSNVVANKSLKPLDGKIIDINGPIVKVAYEHAAIGQICEIQRNPLEKPILGQVIAIQDQIALISPFEACNGLSSGAIVKPLGKELTVKVGDELLGRVVDGLGNPIDSLDDISDKARAIPVKGVAPSPLDRPLVQEPFTTGLRAIDAAITLGKGQRIGIFGPPGTGKSTLISAIAQHCDADVIVIGMIGERGRELREFLDRHLPVEKRDSVVVVASTSDRPPMERLYGAHVATAIAEGFRDQGKSVMLLMDSLTRVARALREIGLAAGEIPTRRGYPASVYPALPEIIERAGRSEKGDITAIYTLLVEGDSQTDPIAEEAKSLMDGHIVLSQEIADSGRYPAIDVLKSLSRVMSDVVDDDHKEGALELRKLLAKHHEIELLLQVGEYEEGSDEVADRAVELMSKIHEFLAQKVEQPSKLDETIDNLRELLNHD